MCYLQQAGANFGGGTFQFQAGAAGAARDVVAEPGRVVAYDAQDVHGVTPVTWGERCTLTLWFTATPEHCEDARLLVQVTAGGRGMQRQQLGQRQGDGGSPLPFLMPATALQPRCGSRWACRPRCGGCLMALTCGSAASPC